MTDAPALPATSDVPATASRWRTRLLMFGVPVLLLVLAAWWWANSGGTVSTDNAYVQMDKVSISAEVGGRIVEVGARENEMVAAGALLFRIDPEPFRLQVAEANAAIDAASVNLGTLSAGVVSAAADIGAAREDVAFARTQFDRQAALLERGFTTRAAYDAARHAVAQAQERVRLAEAEAAEARTRTATGPATGTAPQVEAARVQRRQAEVALSRSEVRAPLAGRVAQAERLQVGQMMVAGLPALTIVDPSSAWVEANFKETDLADMAVGQRAELRFDAFPGITVEGRVDSIGAGTGSEFSVLPAQNATGNWVKVTQRVPVRIRLVGRPARPLIAGLSAKVTVFTDDRTAR